MKMPAKRWTRDEDLRVRSLIEQGRPHSYIAEKLKLTPTAVAARAKLGLKAKEIGAMVRLKTYIEWMSRGRRTNRIAYVLYDPELKVVFKAALEKGVEIITRRE